MRIKRQINKQNKLTIISQIRDKQQVRYTKLREELKDKTKEELNLLLVSKKHSKLDRIAIIHTIRKLEIPITDSVTDVNTEHNIILDDNTNNNNSLSGEDINSK